MNDYLRELAATAARHLDLAGAYAIGSLALGAWRPETSDIDVALVARAPHEETALRALAADLDHTRLPVPARKLECVVYDADRLRRGDTTFVMNLNTGPDQTTVDLDPTTVPGFWFVLDIAIAHRHAIALHGPPATEVMSPPPESEIEAALEESVRWYREHDPAGAASAAARAQHYRDTGAWSAKRASG